MKKFVALLPHGYDWFTAFEHALAFGLSAALAIRVVPALIRAAGAALDLGRAAVSFRQASPGPYLKVFGQRR